MTINERIAAFLRLAKETQTQEEARQLCVNEIASLYAHYAQTSVHTYITRYRRVLEADGLTEPFLYRMQEGKIVPGYLRESDEAKTSNAEIAHQHLRERHQRACEFFDDRALMERATEMLLSPHFTVVLVGLLPLMGRREYETAVTAVVTPDEEHPGYVWYSGQAKTRDVERGQQWHNIPVLADARLICQAVEHLRALCDFSLYRPGASDAKGRIPSTLFNARFAKTLGETSRRYFNQFFAHEGREISPKMLRKIYGVVAYKYCRNPGETLTFFLAERLGHTEKNFASTDYYEDFQPYLMNTA